MLTDKDLKLIFLLEFKCLTIIYKTKILQSQELIIQEFRKREDVGSPVGSDPVFVYC